MTSDRSLWDVELSSEEVAERLVQLGRTERVSPERRARAVESILSVGVVGVTQAAAAHASAAHALSSLSKAPVAKAATPLLFVKSAATGAVVAGALLASVQGVRTVARWANADPAATMPPSVRDLRAPAHVAPAIVEPSRSSVEARSAVEIAGRVASAPRSGTPPVASRAEGNAAARPGGAPGANSSADPSKSEALLWPATDTPSSLSAEVRALDTARLRLRAGDVGAALSLLDAYHAEFPVGALSEEATAVRVEALMQGGRGDEASALAQTFLALHPTSPVAERIRRLVSR